MEEPTVEDIIYWLEEEDPYDDAIFFRIWEYVRDYRALINSITTHRDAFTLLYGIYKSDVSSVIDILSKEELSPRHLNLALLLSIDSGDMDIFKILLFHGSSIGAFNYMSLDIAIRRGRIEMLKAMLNDDSIEEYVYNDAIYIASECNNIEIVKMLLEKTNNELSEIDPDIVLVLSSKNCFDILELLMNNNLSIHRNSHRALYYAALYNNISMVKLFLSKNVPIIPDTVIIACSNNNEEILRLLIENGADVTQYGNAALAMAIATNNEKIRDILLEAGACEDDAISEILLCSVESNNIDCISKYIDAADLKTLQNVFHIAIKENKIDIIHFIMDIKIPIFDPYCIHLVDYVVEIDDSELLNKILLNGIDISSYASSLLRMALIQYNSYKCADILIAIGVDINAIRLDDMGFHSMLYAMKHGLSWKQYFNNFSEHDKIIIARNHLAALRIQKWILSIFSKPFYRDGSMGYLARDAYEQSESLIKYVRLHHYR